MNPHTLNEFRHAVYGCFRRAGDALFNTVDALLTEDRAHSFPELSLSPYFERQWPSLYEAFEDGCIDEQQLRQVFAAFLPYSAGEKPLWVGVDSSGTARPRTAASEHRNDGSAGRLCPIRRGGPVTI
jgi:DDE superfamily endonuclease